MIGIRLGIPGPLSADLHRLNSPPHMPGWNNIDIWETLQAAFNKPLYIDNDANMGALGESRGGAGRGSSDMAYVKIGTGIGAGLILNGRIYRGHRGSAGELGHITIDENGPFCVCGNRGCLETLAAAHAIVADAQHGVSLAHKLDAHDMVSHPHVEKESQNLQGAERRQLIVSATTSAVSMLSNRSTIDIADVIEAAQHGDAASSAALEHAGERIGRALAGLVNLFNPEVIVIDGGVARAGDLLLTPLKRVASSTSLPAAWNGARILPGSLAGAAIALGAAITVLDAAFGTPSFSPTMTAQKHRDVVM